jgi:hypothetical protein
MRVTRVWLLLLIVFKRTPAFLHANEAREVGEHVQSKKLCTTLERDTPLTTALVPLPTSLVEHLALEHDTYDFPQLDLPGSGQPTVCVLPSFRTERLDLEQWIQMSTHEGPDQESSNDLITAMLYGVQQTRRVTYALMYPVAGTLSTEWFMTRLADTRHTVTPTTLTRWREAGLLHYQQKDRPEADSVASILIAASLHKQRRGALPSSLPDGEPSW